MNRERGAEQKRTRRAVLRGVACAAGVAVGSATGVTAGSATGVTAGSATGVAVESRARNRIGQQVDTELEPGVTLFDLNGDGSYAATVEQAAPESGGGGRSEAIHVTSGGHSTVDYAASVARAPSGTTLGDLSGLTYDYYEGANNVNPDEPSGGFAPDETFVVVENADGRHGAYLTYNDAGESGGGGGDGGGDEGGEGGGANGESPAEEWRTFDVLARIRGDAGGTNDWFEYTDVGAGDDGRTFGSAVERFGADARLVRVGVGHGNAVTPATLDLYYDGLTVNGEALQFPSEVVKRTS